MRTIARTLCGSTRMPPIQQTMPASALSYPTQTTLICAFASVECPGWIGDRLTNREHVINQLETLACGGPPFRVIPGPAPRKAGAIPHIDNHTVTAISCTVHGYSSKVDLASLANMVHTTVAFL